MNSTNYLKKLGWILSMMFERLRDLFIYAGVDKESYDHVLPTVSASNRSSMIVYSATALLFISAMFIASFIMEEIGMFRYVYLIFSLLSLVVLIYSTLFYDKYPRLLIPCMYLFLGSMYAFGIILGCQSSPTELSVTFIVLLLAIPLLFADRPIRMILLVLAAMIAFDITILFTKSGNALAVDFLDATVFGLFGCIVGTHMMMVKISRVVYSDRADLLSKTDLLTGCKNRNCYEQELSVLARNCSRSLSCVYVDVNGLHEMNNQHGHTAGDTMLKYVASQLREAFPAGNTYRIGGDEYVTIISDSDESSVESGVRKVVEKIESKDYHISIGFELQEKTSLDLIRLVHSAEEKMYEEKKKYYISRGRGPRGSRL